MSDDETPEWFRMRFTGEQLDRLQWAIDDKRDCEHSSGDDDRAAFWLRMNEAITKQRAGQGDPEARKTALRNFARDCLLSTPYDKRGDISEARTYISEYVGEFDDDSDAVYHALEDAGTAREDRLSIAQEIEKGHHLRPPDGYRDA